MAGRGRRRGYECNLLWHSVLRRARSPWSRSLTGSRAAPGRVAAGQTDGVRQKNSHGALGQGRAIGEKHDPRGVDDWPGLEGKPFKACVASADPRGLLPPPSGAATVLGKGRPQAGRARLAGWSGSLGQ